jgi:diguanylate cyclase (GGDEF)-like protein/PAS domain S-box-containing protein
LSDDTNRQSADDRAQSADDLAQNAEMRAINERLVVAAVRQQELAEMAARSMESALKAGEHYRRLAHNFPNGVVLLFDRDLRHVLAAGQGLSALGLSREVVEGRTIWESFTPRICRRIEPAYRAALAGETTVLEVRFQGAPPDRETAEGVYQVCTLPIREDGGEVLTGMTVVQDVTERRQAEDEAHRRANHDALTGLPNRALLRDRLDQVLAASGRSGRLAALLFLDLDHFKRVNDTLGHAAGDLLLQTVAARLIKSLRAEDTVARIGGDEFVVLLPGIQSIGDAADVARKITALLAAPIAVGGGEVSVTASVGISIYPADGSDAAALMENADAAMYRSKADRRA